MVIEGHVSSHNVHLRLIMSTPDKEGSPGRILPRGQRLLCGEFASCPDVHLGMCSLADYNCPEV